MNKKISLGVTISLIAITAAITFILTSSFSLQTFNEKVKDVKEKADKYQRLDELDTFVRDNYYSDIDETKLMDSIMKGYISGLNDPYAKYMTPEEYKDNIASESGTLVGIGITVEKDESGYIKITEIMDDSPAKQFELKTDDIIVSVDGQDVLSLGYVDAINMIKDGAEGTLVSLTVRRNGTDKEYQFTRKSMELITANGKMLDGDVGYISITKFINKTPEQFIKVLNDLTAQGAKGFIFDVRNNPGGLVDSVGRCLDPLLPEGDIAIATYRDGHTEVICHSDSEQLDLPFVILVNGTTASSAELFSAALRDFTDAKLVGVKTFGKGIMQSTSALDSGGAATVTVATYQTTKSDCYHGIGLYPDYEIALPSDTGVSVQDGAVEEDTQQQKALELLLSK